MSDETPDLIEMDPEKCRSIVASLRMYINFCEQTRNQLKPEHIKDIAWMRDAGSQAMYEASQIGADDED